MFLWPVTWTVTIVGVGYGDAVRYEKRIAQFLILLGDASYPLYLTHLPLFGLLTVFKAPKSAALYLLAAIILSILLDRAFDRPFKWLLLRVAPAWRARRAPATSPVTAS